MPLTAKGKKIMRSMRRSYGPEAERVFYASRNAGRISNVDEPIGSSRGGSKNPGMLLVLAAAGVIAAIAVLVSLKKKSIPTASQSTAIVTT